jgi:uncharacterized protein (TIGR00369 family)
MESAAIDLAQAPTNAIATGRAACSPTVEPPRGDLFGPAEAQELLGDKFAPWVQDLQLVVEDCSPAGVRLRLPYSARLARVGDTVSGQALMACADTAMAIAIFAAFGRFRNVTTVSQNINFMRPIAAADVQIDATVRKLGRSLVFSEVFFCAVGTGAIAAHATSTWALIQ